MNITDSLFFSKNKARILFIFLPRLLVILFLLVQESFWYEGVFLKNNIPLLLLIAADLLITLIYTFQPFKNIFKPRFSTLINALFFIYSVIVFYFLVFSISMPNLFGPSENPYENILIVAIIQLISMGCLFFNLSFRLIPKSFSKRPYIPLSLSISIFILCLLLRDSVQALLYNFSNTVSSHFTALCILFYCITCFYLFITGFRMCYERYLKPHSALRIIIKLLAPLSLIPIIWLFIISEMGPLFFNIFSFLAPGILLLMTESNLLLICFFITLAFLILAAEIKNIYVQKGVFILLCMCLPINLYISVVLLPIFSMLPFIALFSPATLLYFFPYLVLIFHIQSLFRTRKAFTSTQKTSLSRFTFLLRLTLLLFILPLLTVVNAFLDKAVLHQAYYSMNDSDSFIRLDGGRLQRVLEEFNNKRRHSYLPFITPLRRAIILENKNLDKMEADKLYRFYVGYKNGAYVQAGRIVWPRQVLIRGIQEISFSSHGSYMQSKVLIEIENPNQFTDEFYQVFEIPPDVFITDLSLWIGEFEKKGLLARKESALTVYTNIMRALRDPALLMYQNDGSCSLRVFPVDAGQKRRAALSFCYRKPFVFTLGSKHIEIDHSFIKQPRSEAKNKGQSIHTTVSSNMYRSQAEQVLHFIIDYSDNSDISLEQALNTMQDLLTKNNWQGRIRFSLANYNWMTYDALDQLTPVPPFPSIAFQRQGAFVYSRVLTGLLREYDRTSQTPLFIIISDTNQDWLIHSSLLPYKINYPSLRQAYRLDSSGNLYSFPVFAIHNEKQCDSLTDTCYSLPVVMENKLMTQSENLCTVISAYSHKSIAEIMHQSSHLDTWETNALLFSLWSYGEILHHRDPVRYEQLSRYAQKQGLLMPFLSYIVLENRDQEKILKESDKNASQATLLSDGKLKSVSMTEPPLFPLLIALIVILFVPIKKQ
jgi:hypothetical protein